MRVRSHSVRVSVVTAALAAASCGRREEQPAPTDCTQLGSLLLGPDDTRAIRAHLQPAPPLEQTLEFALDVRATEYLETGDLGAKTWPEAIRDYRTRVRAARAGAGIAALQAEVARVRRELGVEAASCKRGS